MPLDSPEAYERLGVDLLKLDPFLDDWTQQRGFVRYFHTGRYPERRYYRESTQVGSFIQLCLQRRDNGERFEEYGPDLLYDCVIGFSVNPCPDPRGRRIILFHHIPFTRLESELSQLLAPIDTYTDCYSIEHLERTGEQFMDSFWDHASQSNLGEEVLVWL